MVSQMPMTQRAAYGDMVLMSMEVYDELLASAWVDFAIAESEKQIHGRVGHCGCCREGDDSRISRSPGILRCGGSWVG